MKKIGLLIFAAAIIIGISVAGLFSFGRVNAQFLNISFNKKIRGSGNTATETRDIRNFKGVDVSGTLQVEVAAQKDFSVQVEADDNLIPLIRTEVRDNVLYISMDKHLSSGNPLKVRVAAPNVDRVEASGVSKVTLTDVKNDELHVGTSGASKTTVAGETSRVSINVSGASSVDTEGLKAETAEVDASGASRVAVFATAELNSDASGASRIVYSGNPSSLKKSLSGASSITAR